MNSPDRSKPRCSERFDPDTAIYRRFRIKNNNRYINLARTPGGRTIDECPTPADSVSSRL